MSINCELKIFDEDFRKLGFWKFPGKQIAKFVKIINSKYDLGITIKQKDNVDKDLDWMRWL